MTNWTINAINTINHNDVEYIYVPFNYALFRDKSNQTHRQFKKIITRQGEIKPCFLFEVEKHRQCLLSEAHEECGRCNNSTSAKINQDRTLLEKRLKSFCLAIYTVSSMGEHLPYKQRVIGSSPIQCTKMGRYDQWRCQRAVNPSRKIQRRFDSYSAHHMVSVVQWLGHKFVALGM